MKGEIISTDEVRARWSYSEVTGRFFAQYYKRVTDDAGRALIEKIRQGIPFPALSSDERKILLTWHETGYRQDFNDAMAWYKSFRHELWSKDQFLKLYAVPVLDPQRLYRAVTLLSFFTSPRFKNQFGNFEETDPRVAADNVPLHVIFKIVDPLVVGHWNDGRMVLYEGYFRAALFVRSEDPDAQIPLWIPFEGNWPGKQ